MSDYKPGTIAVATVRGVPNVRVFRDDAQEWNSATSVHTSWTHYDEAVTDVRPLVVLDLEDAEQVERLAAARLDARPNAIKADELRQKYPQEWRGECDAIQAALREFANPTPPKPPEPQARGAVVKDASGLEWVRVHPGGEAWVNGWQRWAKWSDIDAVEVVRP